MVVFRVTPHFASTVLTAVIAILSASFLFALAHYVGSLGMTLICIAFCFAG